MTVRTTSRRGHAPAWRMLAAVLALASVSVRAEEVVYSTASLGNPDGDVTGSARAIGLGSAFVAVADDSSAALWNQAGLSDLNRPEIAAHHNAWLMDVNKETLVVGMPLKGIGGLGVVGHYIGYGTFRRMDEQGAITGSYSANQMSLGAGLGAKVWKNTSLGAALRGTQQTLAWKSSAFLDADAGLLFKAGPDWRAGISYTNIPLSKRKSTSESVLRVGAAFRAVKIRDYSLRLALSGSIKPQARNGIQFGAENVFVSRFFLRAGYMLDLQNTLLEGFRGLTAGAGILWDDISLDYAFLPFGNLGYSHRVSVSYRFGSEPENLAAAAPALVAAGPAATVMAAPAQQPATVVVSLPSTTVQAVASPSAQPPGQVAPQAVPEDGIKDGQPLTLEFELPGSVLESGKELERQGKDREAERVYREAIQADPKDARAWWALGQLYQKQGRKRYAIQCVERVLQLRPGETKLAEWLRAYKVSPPGIPGR